MGNKVYVGNIAYHTTNERIQEAFAGAGIPTISVDVVRDRETQQSRGFAFVEVADDSIVQKAISALHNTMLDGKILVVNAAQERTQQTATTPVSGGGRGSRSR